ncbi:MAG: glycosyltransferase family 4 protein [Bacteroidia bacterium]
MGKLAIITTHPIQYYAPVFKLLAQHINLKVFYTNGTESLEKFDEGFKRNIAWDLPLLEGYQYELLKNSSKKPGTHHFKGISNPDALDRITAFEPDAMLIYGWANQSHLAIIRYFYKKIPIYFRGDSTLLDQLPSVKSLLKKIFLIWVYKHIDIAFYVGSANKEYYKYYGLKDEQLVFANHAIDNERFGENKSVEADMLRNAIGVNQNEILIVFAGKLETKKNPSILLKAFIELNLANAHLLFVGNGELEDSLKFEVKNKSILSVHFLDFQNQTQIPTIYQASDLFCLPSQGPGETWGLAVNEAMASGKAILVSDKVGCGEDLITPETGMIFTSNDIDDLKQKLIALTQDKTTLMEMGKSAKKHIQNWSFDKQVRTIVDYVNR